MSAAEEKRYIMQDVLFIYIEREPFNVSAGVDYLYTYCTSLYKLTFFQRNNVI